MARSRRRVPFSAQERLILDSGAVLALASGDHRARAFLRRALELGAEVEVPVVVVAETVRDQAEDAPVNRILKAVGSVPAAQEQHGRIAGRLLGQARSASTVDALVVAHAIGRGGGLVLTGDLEDLSRLAAPYSEVVIHRI